MPDAIVRCELHSSRQELGVWLHSWHDPEHDGAEPRRELFLDAAKAMAAARKRHGPDVAVLDKRRSR